MNKGHPLMTLLILGLTVLAVACICAGLLTPARQNLDVPEGCADLNFHWNCCKVSLSKIGSIESPRLQNMIIMDWSTFSVEQYPPYERFSQFHLAVNKELLVRGDQILFTPGDLDEFYQYYKKRSSR